MKHLLIILSLCFSLNSAFTQTYYKASVTEMFVYSDKTEQWELYKKNSDVDIIIILEDQFVSIQANSPTMFKIYESTKQSLNTEKLQGYRYEARDLKKDVMVKVDVLKSKNDSGVALLSVVNQEEGYNLRYYLITK